MKPIVKEFVQLPEWTNSIWNVVIGCNKVSSGCKNCYAERYSIRLKNRGTVMV
jgi:protein gp37